MRTCAAFAEQGADVTLATLAVSRPDAVRRDAVWRHFGVAPGFRILEVPTPLRHDSSVRAFRLCGGAAALALAAATVARLAVRPRRFVVYARSPVLMAPFALLRRLLPGRRRPRLVLETHALPRGAAARAVHWADLVVVTSLRLRRDVVDQLGVAQERVLHVPLGPYNDVRVYSKEEARRALGLPPDAAIACYSGKMLEDQTEFLLQAASSLKRGVPGLRMLLVGGNPRIDSWTRRRTAELGLEDTVVATGFVEPPRVSLFQSAADVLVFYMSESQLHFEYCTPAKGFEYQAVDRPIVASDIPLFEEVFGLGGERAIRVADRTPDALARGIQAALELPDGGASMAARAKAWVSPRTWTSRVEAVMASLDDLDQPTGST
jgi:glycosyltransferase involved in cell wall biosynthesis